MPQPPMEEGRSGWWLLGELLGVACCPSVVDFPENTVLLLRVGHVASHFGQSSWIPTQFSTEQGDLAFMVFAVVLFAKPNDMERI